MDHYRVYALIHGHILTEGDIFDCRIEKISFANQKKRKFTPLLSKFSNNIDEEFHKTYVTFLPYVDTLKIKSEHVIICALSEKDIESALGGAIRKIDKISRFLTFANLEDVKNKHGRNLGHFEPYVYQVNKIYKIEPNGEETEVTPRIESGFVYLPNRPEANKWRDPETEKFLKDSYNFDDEVFQRALKYLYGSATGNMVSNSPEKVALDHIKSLEIIIDSLTEKGSFKARLAEAAKKLNLLPEEIEAIEKFWTDRSKYSDTAHPAPFDRSEMYPNQFPIPDGVMYSGGVFDPVASNVLIKYYHYKNSFFKIDLVLIDGKIADESSEDELSEIYSLSPNGLNHQNHYGFYTTETDRNKLKHKIKKAFSKKTGLELDQIEEIKELQKSNDNTFERVFQIKIKNKYL